MPSPTEHDVAQSLVRTLRLSRVNIQAFESDPTLTELGELLATAELAALRWRLEAAVRLGLVEVATLLPPRQVRPKKAASTDS